MSQELIDFAAHKWDVFVSQNIAMGDSVERIDKLMQGKYRDRAELTLGGSGNFDLFYLIDDFWEIQIGFTVENRIDVLPKVVRRGPWLRQPDGSLAVNPHHVVDVSVGD